MVSMLTNTDMLFLSIWALIGSILGYFAFSYKADTPIYTIIRRGLLSIGIGIFISFPIAEYLLSLNKFSKSLCIMIGGLGAFGLPDFITSYYHKLQDFAMNKLLKEKVGNTNDTE